MTKTTQSDTDPRPWLTTAEVAEDLGVTTATLSAWRKRGEGPPYLALTETVIRYPRDGYRAWLQARTVTPGKPSGPLAAPKPAPTGHPAPEWGTPA